MKKSKESSRKRKRSRGNTSQGVGFMLILLFCVSFEGALDKLGLLLGGVVGLVWVMLAFWLIVQRR